MNCSFYGNDTNGDVRNLLVSLLMSFDPIALRISSTIRNPQSACPLCRGAFRNSLPLTSQHL
jgi:hypothetical protein